MCVALGERKTIWTNILGRLQIAWGRSLLTIQQKPIWFCLPVSAGALGAPICIKAARSVFFYYCTSDVLSCWPVQPGREKQQIHGAGHFESAMTSLQPSAGPSCIDPLPPQSPNASEKAIPCSHLHMGFGFKGSMSFLQERSASLSNLFIFVQHFMIKGPVHLLSL